MIRIFCQFFVSFCDEELRWPAGNKIQHTYDQCRKECWKLDGNVVSKRFLKSMPQVPFFRIPSIDCSEFIIFCIWNHFKSLNGVNLRKEVRKRHRRLKAVTQTEENAIINTPSSLNSDGDPVIFVDADFYKNNGSYLWDDGTVIALEEWRNALLSSPHEPRVPKWIILRCI